MTHSRRPSAFVVAALCAVLLSVPQLSAAHQSQSASPAPQKPATLADFSWLTGRWQGTLGPLTAEQEWMAPKNSTMQGFFRLTDNEKTIVIELFTIRETAGGIEFYFRHFSPELKPLEEKEAYHLNLTKWEGGVFRFDNPIVNQLKDAILTHADADTYISHGDVTDANGQPKVIEVTYHRVK
jgi:opacity protein-like surface antigen